MFSIFKKKKNKSANNSIEITISIPNFTGLEDDSDYLDRYMEELKKSGNPKFNRTEAEKELFGLFSIKYGPQCREYNRALTDEINLIFNIDDIDLRIDQCNKAISFYNEFKTFCHSKGEGGKIYFSDMLEHCHNSKNQDFRYIEKVELELKNLTENYTEMKNQLDEKRIRKEKINNFLPPTDCRNFNSY